VPSSLGALASISRSHAETFELGGDGIEPPTSCLVSQLDPQRPTEHDDEMRRFTRRLLVTPAAIAVITSAASARDVRDAQAAFDDLLDRAASVGIGQ
jgi:hypothetical protein